jgi:hypothetical protein
MVRTASSASTRIVPCRNSAGLSTTTAPPAVTASLSLTARRTTATSAAASPSALSTTWMRKRCTRGANASTITEIRATVNTMSIGETAA